MSSIELSTIDKNKIKKIAEKYDLNLLLLFGSRVKSEKHLHKESDFDVAYFSKRELTGKEMIDLNCALMDVFESDKIDTVDLRRVDPLLRYEIARNSKLLYGNQMDYLEFKAFAFRDYINHQDLFDLRKLLIKKRHKLLKESIYSLPR